MKYNINQDIKKAETLPAMFYKDTATFEALKQDVFLKSWQFIGDEKLVRLPQSVHPFVLLDGFLTEPMLLTRDKDEHISCLTNVCTHRGNVVALNPGKSKKLTCICLNLKRLKISLGHAITYIHSLLENGAHFSLLV